MKRIIIVLGVIIFFTSAYSQESENVNQEKDPKEKNKIISSGLLSMMLYEHNKALSQQEVENTYQTRGRMYNKFIIKIKEQKDVIHTNSDIKDINSKETEVRTNKENEVLNKSANPNRGNIKRDNISFVMINDINDCVTLKDNKGNDYKRWESLLQVK